jgi:hypothetical protein
MYKQEHYYEVDNFNTLEMIYQQLHNQYKNVEKRLIKTIDENKNLKSLLSENKNIHPFID